MLTPIQRASFLRALEVSLSRALNGFTKLITSFSAFLKEPKATQVQTSRGSPLSRWQNGTSWERLGPHKSKAHQAAASLPWEPGIIIRSIQRGPSGGSGTSQAWGRAFRPGWEQSPFTWRPLPAPFAAALGTNPRCPCSPEMIRIPASLRLPLEAPCCFFPPLPHPTRKASLLFLSPSPDKHGAKGLSGNPAQKTHWSEMAGFLPAEVL